MGERLALADVEVIEEALAQLAPAERAELNRLLAPMLGHWEPLPGPQTDAYYCAADRLFYGGSAGGGKTDLLLGLAGTAHRRSHIYRRQYTQLSGLIERAREIYAGMGTFNGKWNSWRLLSGGVRRVIEFGACNNLGDEMAFQGRPADLKAFDEITHFARQQFIYLRGWLRSPDPAQRKRLVCTGNPPTDAEGDWVIEEWAPWLDPEHPDPAAPGELRYTTTDPSTGKALWFKEPGRIRLSDETVELQSVTFIPSTVDDNPFYMRSGYKANLQALPEPLRSKLLKGDFGAGREDDPWQIIPTDWVMQAQARWRPLKAVQDMPEYRIPMSAIGVDVARGGGDMTILTPRHGHWIGEQIEFEGAETPNSQSVAAQVMAVRRDNACVNTDVIGVGSGVHDRIAEVIGALAQPMNASERTDMRDKTGQLRFMNKRAYWWWRMREALDPAQEYPLCLPPSSELRRDLCAPRWSYTPGGVKVESKDDLIKRIGRSPDRGDSAVLALEDAQVVVAGFLSGRFR